MLLRTPSFALLACVLATACSPALVVAPDSLVTTKHFPVLAWSSNGFGYSSVSSLKFDLERVVNEEDPARHGTIYLQLTGRRSDWNSVTELLLHMGYHAGQIIPTTGLLDAHSEHVAAARLDVPIVRLPLCGRYHSKPSDLVTRVPDTQFGCATNRALGAMISDPGDLDPKPRAQTYSAQRAADAINRDLAAPKQSAQGSSAAMFGPAIDGFSGGQE